MTKKFICIVAILAACIAYYFYVQKSDASNLKSIKGKQEVLVVGTSADYPPYAQIDLTTGNIVGLEIDIVQEIARRLNKKLVIKDMPFSSLIVQLAAGQIAMVAAGISPNEERKKSVLFSHPYSENDKILIVSKKDSPAITAISDLYNKQVAVCTGYTSDMFLSQFPEINIVRLQDPTDGIIALQSNSVDAFAIAATSFHIFTQQHPDHNYQVFELPDSSDAYAFAYQKNNGILQQEIDPIIDAMLADGTMQTIKNKWNIA